MSVDYLKDLNQAQLEAVTNSEGPSLVIAGAGSGKTRVLTYRIAYLLNKGIPANEILALTFTNKAAGEMKERIVSLSGYNNSRYLWMGTFHSIFARILRSESDKLGYPSSYTIYDASDSRNLIRSIIRELNLDDKIYKPASIASRISAAKNNLITVSDYIDNPVYTERDSASKMPALGNIYKIYSKRCFKAGAMDFDDLLMNTNILFRDFPAVLEEYREKFRYILVDEYQDTNYSQYLIVKKLSLSHRNLCVVGDDAQSIYSFRGARIENILNFKNDYPDYKLFKLEQNYRSTKTIVDAANSIIGKNRSQIKKRVFSDNMVGEKIQIFESMTDAEEGFKVASDIFDLSLSSQVKWEEIAILYRTNAQSRVFEETLRKRNIPYKIYGGLSFYDRKEVKDIISYFRIVINPSDEEALKRTINYPKRGIGKTTVDRIFEVANREEIPAWSVIDDPDSYPNVLTNATWNKISVFSNLIKSLTSRKEGMNAYDLAKIIVGETGISRELSHGQTPEDISRYENFQELLNAIKSFTESAETNGEPSNLESYLETVSLLTDRDMEEEEERNRVTLMTIHSAKGLEFRYIYIVGMEENLFPSIMSIGTDREIEEERRLFYVAVTRAKERVTLSYAGNRYKWGNLESCRPSRFIAEIDDKFLEYQKSSASPYKGREAPRKTYGGATKRGSDLLSDRKSAPIQEKQTGLSRVSRVASQGADFSYTNDLELIIEGSKVEHERFGEGKVLGIDGAPPNTTATVDFKEFGVKKLLLRFAKLKLI
jgi:DNA helicase-2/ATP-dependent DNA helicase PcrA